MRKPSSESSGSVRQLEIQVVETSVTNNSPSQESSHPDALFQARYVTPAFKPFSYLLFIQFSNPVYFVLFSLSRPRVA